MTDLHRHYLARLDARDFAGLAPFVADRVAHNGHALTREGYGAMIAASVEPAPDLRFVPETVLVEGGLTGEARVAARLAFAYTPLRPFHGLPPNGAVHFTEHAFYRLVWTAASRRSGRSSTESSGDEAEARLNADLRKVSVLAG